MLKILLAGICLLSFFCCDEKIILVIDESEKPLGGVQVATSSLSINTKVLVTDLEGKALLPSNIQGVKFISMNKHGYEVKRIEVPQKWPCTVMMERSK